MEPPRIRARRNVILAGLTLALAASTIIPVLGGPDVAARKRTNGARRAGDVIAELNKGFSNSSTVSLGPTDTTTIEVSGFETPISDVNVTLRNMTQPNLDGLDVLLVGPRGQTAVIFSDVGFQSSANNLTVTLDDRAPSQLPTVGPIANGSFQPTNFQSGDSFSSPPAPTATPNSGSRLGVFNGTDANGTWRLFFRNDDASPTIGTMIGGWSLDISSANGVPTAGADSFQAVAGQTLTIPGTGVLGNDSDPDGDTLISVLAGQPNKGTVTLRLDGSFTYRATKKARGTDSFTYLAQDESGLNALASVNIQIKQKKLHKKGRGQVRKRK